MLLRVGSVDRYLHELGMPPWTMQEEGPIKGTTCCIRVLLQFSALVQHLPSAPEGTENVFFCPKDPYG